MALGLQATGVQNGEEKGGHVLFVAYVVEKGGEVDDAEVELGLVLRLGVDVPCQAEHALNVAPVMRGVVVLHVGLDVGRDGLHERIVGEGVHGCRCTVVRLWWEVRKRGRQGSVESAVRQWMRLGPLRQEIEL